MTLREVAHQYRTEGQRLIGHRKHDARQEALGMANWLDQCVANRTPFDHHATYATQTWQTSEWVRSHGYQLAITGHGTSNLALILQRDDELLVANIPAHLHWDGQRITLNPQEQP